MVRRISSSRPMTGSSLPLAWLLPLDRGRIYSARRNLPPPRCCPPSGLCAESLIASLRLLGVTLAFRQNFRRLRSFFQARAPAIDRSAVTKLSPALSASFSAEAKTLASSGVRLTCPAPLPVTCGIFAMALLQRPAAPALASPPAFSIRPLARPSLSSSKYFQEMFRRQPLMIFT